MLAECYYIVHIRSFVKLPATINLVAEDRLESANLLNILKKQQN